jgi:hypothetical protein
MAAYRDKLMQRHERQDVRQNIDMATAAIRRNSHFNVCYMSDADADRAARALARVAVRALKGRRI